jgi:uncharacterized membrane protein YgaE (UPF0421/DUF939 family)
MEDKRREFEGAKPPIGFIGWEVLIVGGLIGYSLCSRVELPWLVGVLAAFGIAGLGLALLAQPTLRIILFFGLAVVSGTLATLIGMMWASAFVSLIVGLVVAFVVYYMHTAAYEVFDIRQKTYERAKERERYLTVRDEFERI